MKNFSSAFFFFALLMLCFFAPPLAAYDGLMWGQKNVRMIKTEWFDIIFAEGSSESAARLAQNADGIYYEIAAMYGRAPQARMPVVLCPACEQSNAYFSVDYYNHIVIYDTAAHEDLQVFSDDLLSTFRHELTHAFTYNTKNKFWTGMANVFGDFLNGGGMITVGWAEGATLTSESAQGEGRLNDEYAKHVVKQAKIEGAFPAYDDVQGASDKYPAGAYYNFNGAFNEWLQNKFGMQNYADLWYACANGHSVKKTFKKIYEMPVREMWKIFASEIETPDIPKSPLETKVEDFEIRDFFSDEKFYCAKNMSGALFASATSSKNEIVFLEQKSGGVFLLSKTEALKKNPKAKKLFCVSGAQKISLSADGRFLCVCYVDQRSATPLCRVKIFDIQKRKWNYIKGSGMNGAVLVQNADETFLVFQKFFSQKKKIIVQKLQDAIEKKTSEKVFEIPLFQNENATDFCDAGDGRFAFILKKGGEGGIERFFCVANVFGKKLFCEPFPEERMSAKNLSFDFEKSKIYFSYAVPKSMPRFGEFDFESRKFSLKSDDVSGGFFFPVKLNENNFLYVGKFYRQNRLFKISFLEQGEKNESADIASENSEKKDQTLFFADEKSQDNFFRDFFSAASQQKENFFSDGEKYSKTESSEIPLGSPEKKIETAAYFQKNDDAILSSAKKYNPFLYLKKGGFIPVSFAQSYLRDPRTESFGSAQLLPLGVTLMTKNPWDSKNFSLSAGGSILTKSGGISFSASGGSDTQALKWKFLVQSEADGDGWKQSYFSAAANSVVPFGRISNFVFSDEAEIFCGRDNSNYNDFFSVFGFSLRMKNESKKTEKKIFFAENNFSAYYTNVHKCGEGAFEYFGAAAGASFVLCGVFDLENFSRYNDFVWEISPFVQLCVPKLIPIYCRDFFSYNLPCVFFARLFDEADHFLTASAKTVLFSVDIQKAVPFLRPIFANQFYIEAGYSISTLRQKLSPGFLKTPSLFENLFCGNFSYVDYAHLDATLALTPNFGILANRLLRMDFTFEARWYFEKPQNRASRFEPIGRMKMAIEF